MGMAQTLIFSTLSGKGGLFAQCPVGARDNSLYINNKRN